MGLKTFGSGIFVKDPVLQQVGNTVKTRFTLVYNDIYKRHNGERVSQSHFLDFEAWDSAARYIVEHCRKGDKIFVEAQPKQECWEKDGIKRQRIIFKINHFDVFKYDECETDENEEFHTPNESYC